MALTRALKTSFSAAGRTPNLKKGVPGAGVLSVLPENERALQFSISFRKHSACLVDVKLLGYLIHAVLPGAGIRSTPRWSTVIYPRLRGASRGSSIRHCLDRFVAYVLPRHRGALDWVGTSAWW
jgi:hypothetical protein